jgi:hypothetical protein
VSGGCHRVLTTTTPVESDLESNSDADPGVGASAIGRYGTSVIVGCVPGFMPSVVM